MHLKQGTITPVLISPLALTGRSESTKSTKRGLCYVPDSRTPEDGRIWTEQPQRLSWYYIYTSSPPEVFRGLSHDEFEFVPMLWGAPSDINDKSFLNTVKGLTKDGIKISNVLAFNEPDMSEHGGSNVIPSYGAQVWVNNIIPLQKMGIRAGLPAPAGWEHGLPWLEQFIGNCSKIIGAQCAYDFVTLHWYGHFEGLASHIGEYASIFPNTSIWVTEYNLNNHSLGETQSFYNKSAEYLNRLPYIERYSFFGAFRSSVSNVETNATMLSAGGRLANIGRWYLGRAGNGVDPYSTDSENSAPVLRCAVLASLVLAFLAIILVA